METITPENEWILPYNPKYYDLNNALKDLKIIDWHQVRTMKNAKVGDILYIYASSPASMIAYKGAVLNVHKTKSTIDDSKYGLGSSEDDAPGTEYMEVAVFREYDLTQGLSYKDMKAHGLKSSLMGPVKVKGELSEYLHSMDRMQCESDRFVGDIPDTCAVPFPISVDEGISTKEDLEWMRNGDEELRKEFDHFDPSWTYDEYKTKVRQSLMLCMDWPEYHHNFEKASERVAQQENYLKKAYAEKETPNDAAAAML